MLCYSSLLSRGCVLAGNYTIKETAATLLYGSLNDGAGAISGEVEFCHLSYVGLPVFLRHLSTSYDI